jgi:hypothetical protein
MCFFVKRKDRRGRRRRRRRRKNLRRPDLHNFCFVFTFHSISRFTFRPIVLFDHSVDDFSRLFALRLLYQTAIRLSRHSFISCIALGILFHLSSSSSLRLPASTDRQASRELKTEEEDEEEEEGKTGEGREGQTRTDLTSCSLTSLFDLRACSAGLAASFVIFSPSSTFA